MRVAFFLLLFISCRLSVSVAQSNKTGTWAIGTITLPGSKDNHWGGYAELQARTDETFLRRFFYYEYKAGVSYNFDNNSSVLLGGGHYSTYNYLDVDNGPQVSENRLWEQFTSVQYITRVKFEHRYRAEQRFLSNGYRNRFRYRLNVLLPVNNKTFVPGTVFLSVFDEVFFNNKTPNFERNRVSAALGYQFTKPLSVQAGWVNQFNNLGNTSNKKNNMMLIFIYAIQRKKNAGNSLPTIVD